MEGMEDEAADARSAGGSPQGPKVVSRTASPTEATSEDRSGPEWPLDNGYLPMTWLCPQEDRTPMASQSPKAWMEQHPGSSVLEFKVRALKEQRTAGKEGPSPGPTSQERPSYKKSKCRRLKGIGAGAPAEGTSLPDAVGTSHAQNLQLDSSVKDEPARSQCPRPPRPPTPKLACWSGKNSWPLEAAWTLSDYEQGLPSGPGSIQGSPVQKAAQSWPGEPGPCNKNVPTPRKGKSCSLQDDLVTGGDLNSTPLTSEKASPLLEDIWRAGELGLLGTGGSGLSLSDQVEKNRLLLQEMLSVSGKGLPKAGIQAWTSSWDRPAAELPVRDMDWDSGISLQDLDQNRTFGPKPKPELSPRHEEAKHLLQHARMKARTRPLRASHDIVPTIALGNRDDRRSPGLDPRVSFSCRDSLQNGNLSDSSSGESSSGLWPKRGTSPSSHVRFEDESARDVESRYLERLQQRQRHVGSAVLQGVDQGPLRSKPDLTNYINGGVRRSMATEGVLRKLAAGRLHPWGPPQPSQGQGKCRACGNSIEPQGLKEGEESPELRLLQELEAACRGEELLVEPPQSSQSLSSPLALLGEPWVRETHIGDILCPEDVDSALDSTDTSDSCRTDSEEAGTSQPSRAWCRTRRPRNGELPCSPQASCHLPKVDRVEVGDEGKEGRQCTPAGTLLPREGGGPKPAAPEPRRTSLEWQREPAQGNQRAQQADSRAPCRAASTTASSSRSGPSEPNRQAQVTENHQPVDRPSMPSPQQSRSEPPAAHQALPPTTSFSLEGWVPTPPSSKKTAFSSSVPHRKAALAGPHKRRGQGDSVDTPSPPSHHMVSRTCELTSSQTQPCSPQVRPPLWVLSTNNCNNSLPQGMQEPWREATPEGRAERDSCSQTPELLLEDSGGGGRQDFPGPAVVGAISPSGTTLPLAPEKPHPSRAPEGSARRTELRSGGRMPLGACPGLSPGPSPTSAAPSEKNKKSSGIASTLGLKKFFSALGHSTRPKLGKSRSYSVEELHPAPGPASHTSTPKLKRAPSLQSLHLVSPSPQHRKAASFQNLHSLLSSKGNRSSLYLVGEPGDPNATGRPAQTPPRRALSVEDVSAPSLARTVGRVVEVYPDGTSQLQLQRSPEGTFGFCVASGNGRPDSGIPHSPFWGQAWPESMFKAALSYLYAYCHQQYKARSQQSPLNRYAPGTCDLTATAEGGHFSFLSGNVLLPHSQVKAVQGEREVPSADVKRASLSGLCCLCDHERPASTNLEAPGARPTEGSLRPGPQT
ncbi:PREDICTED: uncharacterized protein KIAA1614 homolog [Elephantulus edwardii]|uniref:uncharacterized protein KIAA1614 homolog n=1 Tax=Elephantulus edwardii TaxID=28737 RepID=UPI0003F0816E|nr:PREDICTED: uncharacterized protein KIAA1614 homolog [Elephantulus edwardii]